MVLDSEYSVFAWFTCYTREKLYILCIDIITCFTIINLFLKRLPLMYFMF